ncbi:aminotransferase class I/II-fold pyridoxal phosphate-dependent enzyme [Pedobacter sp. Du54]|uniref:aminotransferase class I/II-fold pyridoxal phosphate-dependent enzyme n=1 Tax=Pedobacter anseongensis TaxID=3133439 RepID=UPI0030B06B51
MKLPTQISRKLTLGQESYLYFGGTAYLGIPQHEGFRKLYLEGLERFGLNNGTSRANNVQLGIYDDAEQFAATYYGAGACLITSSGYLAAQLAIKNLSAMGEVRYAPATHPALWINETPKTCGSFNDWSKSLVKEINSSKIDKWVVISNSLNNLYPEVYNFSFLKAINEEKQIILIVDDSHGIGIINNGKGAIPALPRLKNIEILIVASMAKALGVDAGLILGPQTLISTLKQSNEFLGASPPSAAGLFAFMHASSIYQHELSKLNKLSNYLAEALKDTENWLFTADFPVFLATSPTVNKELKKNGILISSFAYPDKNGSLINRIVLSSWHTCTDIEELILALTNIHK